MNYETTEDQLIEDWTLDQSDFNLLANKSGATRLGFALQLKYFQIYAKFAARREDFPSAAVAYLAKQLIVPIRLLAEYDWNNRTAKFKRSQIRERFGFRDATVLDEEAAVNWLINEILPQ